MSDPLRFTPLHVIRMFLNIKYGENSNIIIPEALLEHKPGFEENLRQNLKNIDMVAESGNSKQIIEYITDHYCLMENRSEYLNMLGNFFDIFDHDCANLESFMRHVKIPNIINRDFVRDLVPVNARILYGNYRVLDVFDYIFKYILYTKTKHLRLFSDDIVMSLSLEHNGIGKIGKDFIFNY